MTPDEMGFGEMGLEDWEEESGRRARGRRPVPPRRPTRPRPRPRPRPWPPRPRPPWGSTVVEPSPAEPGGGAPEPSAEPAAPRDSEYVRWIQSALNQVAGLRLPVDGVLGSETRSAIRSFQERSGLPADGIVGPDTERALIAARKRRTASAGETAPLEAEFEGPLDRTSASYVRWIQQSLNQVLGTRLATDGRLGPATRAATRLFQQRQGLSADGVIGPRTEQALVTAGASAPPTTATPTALTPVSASATTLLVRGAGLPAAPALQVTNFLDPRIARFINATRPGRSVTELIVHETEVWSVSGTVKVLQDRQLGVHLILGPDGALTQHADLGDHVTWHAGDHNGRSVGVEVVNPIFERHLGLYRRLVPRGAPLPWSRAIPAGWLEGGSYLLPTPAQAEALARLVAWITSSAATGLSVPRQWTGVSGGRFPMRLVPGAERVAPGISAHSHISAKKQDGAWLVLYAWLRLEAGLTPGEAYEQAAQLAAIPGASATLPAARSTASIPV